ncbi:hypothetical protein BDN70DRAFT_988179 [Pholiota conissans]|uniref:F-box domain-containing protein n=1 Tax=Pholiota conissans TaxID=109636 RepID=A0A9P6D0C3_9AGAR|nr:hypothetical protein BDN70DRAFT_988179 [Pholiota conissans]
MDSTKGRNILSLPPEILDLIVSNLAPPHYKELTYWTSFQRHDLSVCGLVSQAFYTPSRRYLFGFILVRIVAQGDGARVTKSLNRIRQLREIISSNPMLQRMMHHFFVACEVANGPPGEQPITSAQLEESGFISLLRLFSGLRMLTIFSTMDGGFGDGSYLCSALDILRMRCPRIVKIKIQKMINVPSDFLLKWQDITDLQVNYVEFTGDVSDTVKKQGRRALKRYTLLCFLIRSTIPKPLQLLDLRYLKFLDLRCSNPAILDEILSQNGYLPTLDHLILTFAFDTGHLHPLSVSAFPSLKSLEIRGTPQGPNDVRCLSNIVRFLTPETSKASNIQFIGLRVIAKNSERLILGALTEWSELDKTFTSNYQQLSNVDVCLEFELDVDNAAASWVPIVLDKLDNFPSHFLPLTLVSRSISLDFSAIFTIPANYGTLQRTWGNFTLPIS